MRGVVAVTAVLLASVLSSGCFVEEDDPSTQSTSEDAGAGSSSATGTGKSGTGTGAAPGGGSPPVIGNASVNVTGLEAAFTLVATDGDNDTLSWSLAFGDNATANGTFQPGVVVNATAMPQGRVQVANATHAYAAAGTYNATLTVSDGRTAVNRTLTVTVAAGVASEPMAPLAFSGSCTTELDETVDHVFTVTPGQALIHATIAIGGGGVDIDWAIIDPSGNEADAGTSFTPRGEDPLDVAAPAAGDWTIQVTCFLGAAASYDIDVTFV